MVVLTVALGIEVPCDLLSESKAKNDATGVLRPLDIRSSFLKDGAFLPRSIKLRKSTEIPANSANCS